MLYLTSMHQLPTWSLCCPSVHLFFVVIFYRPVYYYLFILLFCNVCYYFNCNFGYTLFPLLISFCTRFPTCCRQQSVVYVTLWSSCCSQQSDVYVTLWSYIYVQQSVVYITIWSNSCLQQSVVYVTLWSSNCLQQSNALFLIAYCYSVFFCCFRSICTCSWFLVHLFLIWCQTLSSSHWELNVILWWLMVFVYRALSFRESWM